MHDGASIHVVDDDVAACGWKSEDGQALGRRIDGRWNTQAIERRDSSIKAIMLPTLLLETYADLLYDVLGAI